MEVRLRKSGMLSGSKKNLSPTVMYRRTQNENGSYGSRCFDCFMTIASYVEAEKKLDVLEAHPMCP
jgi:hypothetical protein